MAVGRLGQRGRIDDHSVVTVVIPQADHRQVGTGGLLKKRDPSVGEPLDGPDGVSRGSGQFVDPFTESVAAGDRREHGRGMVGLGPGPDPDLRVG